jgi:molybdopterin-binding protein
MKISARNVLKGKVKQVTSGAINSEIIVEIAVEDSFILEDIDTPEDYQELLKYYSE